MLKKPHISHLLEQPVPINRSSNHLLVFTTKIVSAHIGHNDTPTDALPGLIRDVYNVLADIQATTPRTEVHQHTHEHAAPQGSATRTAIRVATHTHAPSDDLLVCLEDGLSMKMLKRHLITVHGLTPDQYRAKWGLPSDYPMVAASYAKLRSSLAKESGLGLRPDARPKRYRS